MAYVLKRQKRIKEQLKLIDENDNVVKVIDIDFDVDEKMKAFNKARNDVIRAEQDIANANAEDVKKAYGDAIISLLTVIFGEDGANNILEFYDNRYVEMTEELMPFIATVFIPEMEKRAREKRDKLAAKYVANKR